jgi:hypothetical protein
MLDVAAAIGEEETEAREDGGAAAITRRKRAKKICKILANKK